MTRHRRVGAGVAPLEEALANLAEEAALLDAALKAVEAEDRADAIVAAAERLVGLWLAERAAQWAPTRTSSPAPTSPPRSVLTAARRALEEAVRS